MVLYYLKNVPQACIGMTAYLSFFFSYKRRKNLGDKGNEVDSIVSYLQKDIWSVMPQILYRETREVWIRSSSFNIDTKLTKENQTHKAISYCIVYRDYIKLKSIIYKFC